MGADWCCDDDLARLERLRTNLRCNAPQLLPAARRAAVACLLRLTRDSQQLQCLFITRAAHPGDPGSGDVAWPGGRLEAGESELQAAVREVREEIGVDLRSADGAWQLLGPLPDRPAVRTAGLPKLVVRAFVFLHDERLPGSEPLPPFKPVPREVSNVWWVPLKTLTHCGPLPFFDVPVARLQTRLPMLVRATHALPADACKGVRNAGLTCPRALRTVRALCATRGSRAPHAARPQRSPRVRDAAAALGLDTALFPFLLLPAPDPLASSGPTRLWGVTLGLASLLVEAADGDAAALRVPPWRLRHPAWDALIDLAAYYAPAQWERL